MSERKWVVSKTCFCEHVNTKVALETELVYPADMLPDQPARVLAHRCSQGLFCNQNAKSSCIWAGTNPGYDPFRS